MSELLQSHVGGFDSVRVGVGEHPSGYRNHTRLRFHHPSPHPPEFHSSRSLACARTPPPPPPPHRFPLSTWQGARPATLRGHEALSPLCK